MFRFSGRRLRGERYSNQVLLPQILSFHISVSRTNLLSFPFPKRGREEEKSKSSSSVDSFIRKGTLVSVSKNRGKPFNPSSSRWSFPVLTFSLSLSRFTSSLFSSLLIVKCKKSEEGVENETSFGDGSTDLTDSFSARASHSFPWKVVSLFSLKWVPRVSDQPFHLSSFLFLSFLIFLFSFSSSSFGTKSSDTLSKDQGLVSPIEVQEGRMAERRKLIERRNLARGGDSWLWEDSSHSVFLSLLLSFFLSLWCFSITGLPFLLHLISCLSLTHSTYFFDRNKRTKWTE